MYIPETDLYVFGYVCINLFFYHVKATTTTFGQCTTDFDGTSAATPVASGAIALTLEAK